jgi:hypothetical protein
MPATCRSDLLTVDGTPVWVSVTGSTATALARGPLDVSLCGPDATGLTLGSGDHTLLSASGQTVGLDIDQLALTSAPGGGAAAVLPGGQLAAPATSSVGSVQIRSQTDTRMTLAVSGITSTTAPFELVLGQSINSGWTATAGGRQLSSPVLVDGFANGWQVNPSAVAGSIQDGTLLVTMVWAPQRTVNVALLISALGLVLCLGLILFPLGRRRRHPVVGVTDDDATDVGMEEGSPGVVADAGPALMTSWAEQGRPTGWRTAVVTGALCGLAASYISAPLIGGLVGAGVLVVLRVPRLRLLLGVAATAMVLASGTFILIRQGVDHSQANGGWPAQFGGASGLAWAGVLFIGADAVVELVTRRGSVAPSVSADVAPDDPLAEPESAAP